LIEKGKDLQSEGIKMKKMLKWWRGLLMV